MKDHTGDLFTHVTWDNQIAWETTTRGVRWFMREANKYVVAFAHPEARVDDSLLVYGLLDAIREIIQSSLSDL